MQWVRNQCRISCEMLGTLLVALLASKALAKSITVVCEEGQDTPFCGQYNEESDGFYLTTDSDDNGWRFRILEIGGELCLQLRNGDQLCGQDHVDELTRVRDGVRSTLTGYIMEFQLWLSCDPSDYYCDDETQDNPDKKQNYEISGGTTADQNYLPYMVRLFTKGAQGRRYTCGGALIHPKFVLTANHCVNTVQIIQFSKHCLKNGNPNNNCAAYIGDHFVDKTDPNEQRINLLKVHNFDGDLAVIELAKPAVIDDHTSRLVHVSSEQLQPGDIVRTAGWGFTDAKGGLSNVLVTTELEVSQGGSEEQVLTKVSTTKSGAPVDPCDGDSGGPLLKWSEDRNDFVLHATLLGGGYDCFEDKTDGDGQWNNVFPHLAWLDSFAKGIPAPPLLTGSWPIFSDTESLELIGGGTEPGDTVHKGSVFIDREPVCDRGWDDLDAGVVCRQLGFTSGVATNGSLFIRVPEGTNFSRSDVGCSGSEGSLEECLARTSQDCRPDQLAGVTCRQGDAKTDTLVLSSTAGVAERQGDTLGEYRREGEWGGRGYWRQRSDVGEEEWYLHYNKDKNGGSWVLAKGELGGEDYMRNLGDSELPPETGLEYFGDGRWNSDSSLTLAYGPLVPCTGVTVAMEGEAAEAWVGDHLQGMYRPTGQWSAGRPVYRGEEGSKAYLTVGEGDTWSIRSTVTSTLHPPPPPPWIRGGRATSSPGDPRAGGSESEGVTRWRYHDSGWKEGDITVTCEM